MRKIENSGFDNKSYNGEYVMRAVDRAVHERARYLVCFYDTLVEEMGKEKATEICNRALWSYGKLKPDLTDGHPGDVRPFAEAATLGIEYYCQEHMHNTLEFLTEDKAIVHLQGRCALVDAWRELGLSTEKCKELCEIACHGDYAHMDTMGLKCTFSTTFANGDDHCEVIIEKK
ncbi:L-2-amino-thiazoline-4-carboxylic acid hydrolase [Roseburia hominis]